MAYSQRESDSWDDGPSEGDEEQERAKDDPFYERDPHYKEDDDPWRKEHEVIDPFDV